MKTYNVKDTAKMLSVSTKTIYRWISQRKIEHHKIGGRVLFTDKIINHLLIKTKVRARDDHDKVIQELQI